MTTNGATEIEVHLPTLLRESAGGATCIRVSGATLAEALRDLRQRYPLLRVHLYDSAGRQRRHVVVFYNGESVSTLPSLDAPLRPGDQLEVVQAVSGG